MPTTSWLVASLFMRPFSVIQTGGLLQRVILYCLFTVLAKPSAPEARGKSTVLRTFATAFHIGWQYIHFIYYIM